MEHKLFIVALLAIALSHTTNGRTKDPDEDRAYEFGFTIEGMQHRHEKKDVNGIIQGEFGFITADGVYHVTVYATDENGNFRILSMKNIKVSPPLDGSPDYGSSKYASSPKASQSPSLQPVQVQKRTDVSTTRAPNRAFTTQPTLKPACAGCGYVTTSKRPPIANGQLAGPQSSILSGPQSGQSNGQSSSGIGATGGTSFFGSGYQDNRNTVPGLNKGLVAPGVGSSAQGQGVGNTAQGQVNVNVAQGQGAGNFAANQGNANFGQNLDIGSSAGDQSPNNKGISSVSGNLKPQIPSSISSYSDSFSNPPNSQNEVLGGAKPNQHSSQITYRNPDPPVKVTNGVIKVPGNPDIEIKDKYPGMVDGLPAGIAEKDITDILYRFNWTVGFQGHYETGYKNGAKVGGYFVNGSDGISRVVTYVADEFGYRPKVRIINIGLDSPDTPKDDKTFELKSFEFVWYPVK